jgi:hypothetical protein
MYSVTVTAKGAVFEGKAPEIINAALTGFMQEAVTYLEREVKRGTPTGVYGAQGGLLSTISGEVTGKGTPLVKGVVGHGRPQYGNVIEKGRTGGKAMPPSGTLVRWLEVKLGLSEKEAQRIEFVVRRKIGRRGFPGAEMFEGALNRGWPAIQAMGERAGFDLARKLNG